MSFIFIRPPIPPLPPGCSVSQTPLPNGLNLRSAPSVQDCIDLKERCRTLKLRPQLLDVEYAGQRTVQFRHDMRRLPILRLLVKTQQMLVSFKLDMLQCCPHDNRERDAVLLGQ